MTTVNHETGEIESTINYRIHPIADLFPYIEGAAFREFVEDIRANGQREPVVLDGEGRLLDGRNRARACQALGIDVKETRYDGDDVEAWIISHNIHRRHLTTSQRAMVAGKLATLKHGSNQHGKKVEGCFQPSTLTDAKRHESAPSIMDAAQKLSVGRESVKYARTVIESGDEALIKAVEAGEVSVAKAAKQVRAKKEEQPDSDGPIGGRVRSEVRAQQIAELAKQGATSEQIAKRIGIGVPQIKNVARANNIEIPGDVVTFRTRRANNDRVLHNVAESVDVAAMSLRDIDPASLDSETAAERLDSLTASINALTKAVKKIKESLHV